MEAQQVSAKLYVDDASGVTADDFIRAFHSWIQQNELDELLIDVTDYSHVHRGPGVLLIAHDAQYGMDEGEGRLGLLYLKKRDEPGPLADKLRDALSRALTACRLLEQTLDGRIAFRGDEILVRVHNRLIARNDAETLAGARPDIDAVTAALYDGVRPTVEPARDPKQMFSVRVKSSENPSVATLIERLGGKPDAAAARTPLRII